MKSKNMKKLTLAKETLKLLNTNELANVQSGLLSLHSADLGCLLGPLRVTSDSL